MLNEKRKLKELYAGLGVFLFGVFLRLSSDTRDLSIIVMIVGVGGIVYSLGQSLFEEYKFNKNKNDKPTYLGGWKDNSLYAGKYLYVYLSKEKGQWKTKGKLAGVKEGVYLVGKDAVEWPDYKTAKEQIALKWAKILKVPFKENEKQEKLLS